MPCPTVRFIIFRPLSHCNLLAFFVGYLKNALSLAYHLSLLWHKTLNKHGFIYFSTRTQKNVKVNKETESPKPQWKATSVCVAFSFLPSCFPAFLPSSGHCHWNFVFCLRGNLKRAYRWRDREKNQPKQVCYLALAPSAPWRPELFTAEAA